MPLDPLSVATQVRHMGERLVSRRADEERRLAVARRLLAEAAESWPELAAFAETTRERVAVPTCRLDGRASTPPRPAAYTALATDGSEVDPDRHGSGGAFYLINIGSAKIPYGQPERETELRSRSDLRYEVEDLFIVDPGNPRRQVPVRERHLDARRTVQELEALADLAETEAEQHGDVPAVALVDGTLLFSVLAERPQDFLRAHFYRGYVAQLDRLRAVGVALAAYASRTRGLDLVSLFRARCGGDPAACEACGQEPLTTPPGECAWRGLTDAQTLGFGLAAGERSALFRIRSNVHDPYYRDHRISFFLLGTETEIARVEVPEWVAADPPLLDLVHAVLVDQCAKGLGYPAVLARADDRAVISTQDRVLLEGLVSQELARRGVHARPSAKLGRKQVRTV